MEELLYIAAGFSTVSYLLVGVIAAVRLQSTGYPIVPALLFTSIWSIYGATSPRIDLLWVGFWATGLLMILQRERDLKTSKVIWLALWSVPVFSFVNGIYFAAVPSPLFILPHFFCSIGVLLITEQVIRATRGYLRAMALGLGTLFLFELYVVSRTAATSEFSNDLLHSRVLLNAAVAGFLLVTPILLREERQRTKEVALSRPMAFTTTSLLVAGGLITFVAVASYILETQFAMYRAIWQPSLFFSLVLLLGILLRSSTQRARLRVWVNKNFFRTKYDYNSEWQKLTERLSSDTDTNYGEVALQAMVPLYHAHRSVLYLEQNGQLLCETAIGLNHKPEAISLAETSEFAELLHNGWIFITETDNTSLLKENHQLPEQITQLGSALIVAPLLRQNVLIGLVVMVTDQQKAGDFDWEDIDLLGLLGRQVANYVAYQQLAQASAIQGQFETYHQLSTFVMHDLKNLIAQQMLVIQNAERFKDNPEFVSDAIKTIENSVKRMNRLMLKINKHSLIPESTDNEIISLSQAINTAILKVSNREPKPEIVLGGSEEYTVQGEPDSVIMALTHIMSNAQEACSPDDKITIQLESGKNQSVTCKICDTGSGMDQDFIDRRLFKPFDSTKKTVGMGIGAYQSKQIISKMRGELSVESTPGEGTCFTITLPLA